mmetsp:Transcript_41/g.55  ORF Transcript_41/g.55 Transcript_41/m.55 type:complete len:216 (-) Transcript_41:323-970(-)
METENTTYRFKSALHPKRFKRLGSVLEKALLESAKNIDSHTLVSECYGEDANIFVNDGDSDGHSNATNILATLIDGVIDRTNEIMRDEVEKITKAERLDLKLNILDHVIDDHERMDRQRKESEEEDRRSARIAVEESKLPDGITVSDALRFQEHLLLLENKENLEVLLARFKNENNKLEKELIEEKKTVEAQISRLKVKDDFLLNVADLFSMSEK